MLSDLEYKNVLELDLRRPENLSTVQEAVAYIYDHELVREAWHFRRAILEALRSPLDAELEQVYGQMLVVLKWLALPLLPEDDVQTLFREQTLQALRINIGIERAMLRKIWQTPPDIFPELAQRYLANLRANTEQIGTEPIEVRGEPGPQPPTLGKYFTDYHFTIGEHKATPLDMLQYMNQDPDIVRLDPQEKELLKRAFRFYEGLKPIPLEEIRKHLTPEELELSKLGTLPAPTPEEREALGIPFEPAIRPSIPSVPPVIRLERKPAPPYVPPPVDLKTKAPEVKPAPEVPAFEKIVAAVRPTPPAAPTPPPAPRSPDVMSGQVGRASLMPAPVLPFTPPEEKLATAEIRPVHPVVAKPLPALAPKGAGEGKPQTQPATQVQPPLSTLPTQQPIPTQEKTQKEIGDYRIIRPIGGLAGREPKNINPKDTQPSLEGNIVDLKGP